MTFYKKILVVLIFTLASCTLFAYQGLRKEASISIGPRFDTLNWNIAGNYQGTDPNILSELSWRDLKSYQVNTQFKLSTSKNLFIQGQLAYGRIYSGKNQDSDYQGDNRTEEFSRSNNSANEGSTLDFSLGFGQNFHVFIIKHLWMLSPEIGYSISQQKLTIHDGVQTISSPGMLPLGPFSGLDSSYDTMWQGLFLGGQLRTPIFKKLSLFSAIQYHIASFDAKANWNLRDGFKHPVSFRHKGNGYGFVFQLGLGYHFKPKLTFSLTNIYQRWQIKNGTDTTFHSNGSEGTNRLNLVNWHSDAIMLGMTYFF